MFAEPLVSGRFPPQSVRRSSRTTFSPISARSLLQFDINLAPHSPISFIGLLRYRWNGKNLHTINN